MYKFTRDDDDDDDNNNNNNNNVTLQQATKGLEVE
jgi:hypothetical protein